LGAPLPEHTTSRNNTVNIFSKLKNFLNCNVNSNTLIARIRESRSLKKERKKALSHFQKATEHGLVGPEFFTYGIHVAKRLQKTNPRIAKPLFTIPVDTTRFFEFDYTWRALNSLESNANQFLDVSSPFLFSFRVAETFLKSSVLMINPDTKDLRSVKKLRDCLHMPRLILKERTIQDFKDGQESLYDAIWSLSVVEHISGAKINDSSSLQIMWSLLKPGGLLILTVPTDKTYWEEFRSSDVYGQNTQIENEPVFFQRFYDESSIRNRLIEPLGVEPETIEWFGTKQAGVFHKMIENRLSNLRPLSSEHCIEMATSYQIYPTFDSMPGEGVCGLCFRKPKNEQL
jgi:hypothetical protein